MLDSRIPDDASVTHAAPARRLRRRAPVQPMKCHFHECETRCGGMANGRPESKPKATVWLIARQCRPTRSSSRCRCADIAAPDAFLFTVDSGALA